MHKQKTTHFIICAFLGLWICSVLKVKFICNSEPIKKKKKIVTLLGASDNRHTGTGWIFIFLSSLLPPHCPCYCFCCCCVKLIQLNSCKLLCVRLYCTMWWFAGCDDEKKDSTTLGLSIWNHDRKCLLLQ